MARYHDRCGWQSPRKVVRMNRDVGLDEAIGALGGTSPLARALDVTVPTVSSWRHLPAEHVLSVETLTGVARSVLRPDLYPDPQPSGDDAAAAGARDEIAPIGRAHV